MFTDLKKLIKYENRRGQKQNIEIVTPANSNKSNFFLHPNIQADTNQEQSVPTRTKNSEISCNDPLCPYNQADIRQNKEESDDIFNHLHNQHTVASRGKEIPKREKHISVHIKKPKNKAEIHRHCTHLEKENVGEDEREGNLQLIQNIETISDGSKLYINTESTIRSTEPISKQSSAMKPVSSKKKSKCSCMLS